MSGPTPLDAWRSVLYRGFLYRIARSPTISPFLSLCLLRLFPLPILSAAPLPRIVLEAPRPACPRGRNIVPRGLSHAAALIKVRWRCKALFVMLRILVDPQHIPMELPGPLFADFGPLPHQTVTKNLTEDLKPRGPPEEGD